MPANSYCHRKWPGTCCARHHRRSCWQARRRSGGPWWIVVGGLARLGVDAPGPGDLLDGLRRVQELTVESIEDVVETVAPRMREDLAVLPVHLRIYDDVSAGLVVVAAVVRRVLVMPADLASGCI